MISLRSRIERMQERYSTASLCADSERSVGSDDDDKIGMTIEVELCSALCQPYRCKARGPSIPLYCRMASCSSRGFDEYSLRHSS